jgi:hypothetical protein
LENRADNWQNVLEPIIARYRSSDIPRFFRVDAGFADPEIYRFLESEDYFYAIRLKGNNILYGHIEHLLTRPVRFGSNYLPWLAFRMNLQENCLRKGKS